MVAVGAILRASHQVLEAIATTGGPTLTKRVWCLPGKFLNRRELRSGS